MKYMLPLLLLIVTLSHFSKAQSPGVKPPSKRLIADTITKNQNKFMAGLPVKIPLNNLVPQMVWNAAAPDRPGRLLVCIFGWNALYRRAELNAYLSSDNGITWKSVLQDTSSPWVSEISCAFGLNGAAYIVAGVSKRTGIKRGHAYGKMHVYRSADGGFTWKGLTTGPFIDWTAITVDATKGVNQGRVYLFGHDIANGEGSWMGPSKPLLVSTNKGVSFSSPRGVGKWPESGGGYPIGASVLADGTVVCLYRNERPAGFVTVLSKDGGQTLQALPLLPRDTLITNTASLSAGFAVDQSGGPQNGRFYIAYPAIYAGYPVIILSRSDDKGMTWRSSIAAYYASVSSKSILGWAGIAVNRNGLVGLTWSEPIEGSQHFAISQNGGDSFEQSILLSKGRTSPPSNGQHLQYYMQTMGSYEPNVPLNVPPGSVAKGRGLSIRLSYQGLSYAQLSTDASGVFHPVWLEEQDNGELALMTNAINISNQKSTVNHINLNGLTRITDKVAVDVVGQQFNANDKTFILSFKLTNLSDSILKGPIRIFISKLNGGYGFNNVKLLNADNFEKGTGAIFDLSNTMVKGFLLPGNETLPFRIGLNVDLIVPFEEIWGKIKNGQIIHPVSAQMEIYGIIADHL